MLDKLEMFIALTRERHFGRAAESLNIAQPTLSAGIKQLEEQLGVQLVFRGSRFGGLTPEGQAALVWANRIAADTRQLREAMRIKRHGLSGELRLAVIPTAQTWATQLSGAFEQKHPKVRFTIQSRNSRDILAMLENFEADAGISYTDNEPLGRVDTVTLYHEDYVAVCAAGTPLAGEAAIGWDALDGEPLALLTPDMQNRRIINQQLAAHGVTPRIAIESNSLIVLVASVASGTCVAVLPVDVARFLAAGKPLSLVRITGGNRGYAVGLLVPHQDPRSPVIDALMGEAKRLGAGR